MHTVFQLQYTSLSSSHHYCLPLCLPLMILKLTSSFHLISHCLSLLFCCGWWKCYCNHHRLTNISVQWKWADTSLLQTRLSGRCLLLLQLSISPEETATTPLSLLASSVRWASTSCNILPVRRNRHELIMMTQLPTQQEAWGRAQGAEILPPEAALAPVNHQSNCAFTKWIPVGSESHSLWCAPKSNTAWWLNLGEHCCT